MRIPLYTSWQEGKAEQSALQFEKIKSETKLIKERTTALEGLTIAKNQALKVISDITHKPAMTLNDELYGGSGKPYESRVWNGSHKNARRLSRIAEFESPAAQAMIGRFVDMVIGPRLDLQASPLWDLIPGSPTAPEERQKLLKLIEARYKLYSSKKTVSYDAENNNYKLSRQLFEELIIDGEYFVILRYSATRKKNPLTLQQIKPDHVQRVDSKVAIGNTEVDGIERDARGRAVAYHIIMDPAKSKSVRVPRFGTRSGRTFVIHNKIGRGRRGVGLLAGIITELTKLADYQALEIQAAVINALFALSIETAIGGENKTIVTKRGINGIDDQPAADAVNAVSGANFTADLNKTAFNNGGIIVQNMGEGQTLKSHDTKRPTANFEEFFNAVKRNLFSAKGMSIAVADYKFDGSYSAARGELLVFWTRVMTLRFDHMTDYESVIYQMWLWGEVDRGKISLPGWEDDEIREAWSNAHWSGPQRPDIDPLRSFKAAEGEVKEGFKTRQMTTSERGGGDYDENAQRLISENEQIAVANKPVVELDKTTFSFSENKTESETTTIESGGGE